MQEHIEPNPLIQANVLLDLWMLVGTRGGRERTVDEFAALVTSSGGVMSCTSLWPLLSHPDLAKREVAGRAGVLSGSIGPEL